AVPHEFSIWMGVSKNPSTTTNAGEWALVWSSKTGSGDDFARIDVANEFSPFQYLKSGNIRHQINAGHEGGVNSPKGAKVPLAPGDSYTQSYSKPGFGETRNIWIAAIEGDTQSWKRVLCEDDKDVVMSDRKVNFMTRDNFIDPDTDTKRKRVMGARINNTWGSVYNGVSPTMFGEVVACEEYEIPGDNTSPEVIRLYMAVGTERKSWIEIGYRKKADLSMIDDGTNN
ncbi:MAG: hypothetical protein ACRDC4_00575, partial [Plesiomonas sp.]